MYSIIGVASSSTQSILNIILNLFLSILSYIHEDLHFDRHCGFLLALFLFILEFTTVVWQVRRAFIIRVTKI